MYNATAHLRELQASGRHLCFYPSCGDRLLSPLLSLNSDVFVLSDYYARTPEGRRKFWGRIVREFASHGVPLTLYKATKSVRVAESRGKWLFLFFLDNNKTLERIAETGWQISQFVGLNDGCREGGNYECVHDEPFLGRLLAGMRDGADYFTDHSDVLTTPNSPRSTRSHALYKSHFLHESGRLLLLSRILIIRGLTRKKAEDNNRSEPEVFQPPVCREAPSPAAWRSIEESAALELLKMIPFRTLQHTGIIAHYQVAAAVAETTAGRANQTRHASQ